MNKMNIVDIINIKREKGELTREQLEFAFNGYLEESVKDYQMSALLMAICINGMTDPEIFSLTDIFINSGDKLDLSMINGVKIDKHSTGGVGDKVTMIIGPIVASLGVPVPKMSGRGLGHTGGTIDKLESIKGFNVNLTEEEFIKQVNEIGFAVTAQTKNLCPLDKVIYALRDVTGTTQSIPLIASSIMSKKIAGGADKILLDVKVGDGALMKNMDDAKKLADIMTRIGEFYHKEVHCELTDMNTPLGDNIGNSLEVMEAMDVLDGKKGSLYDLCYNEAALMVSMSKGISIDEAKIEVEKTIESKKALEKFKEFVKYQHGDIDSLEVSKNKVEIKSDRKGKIEKIKALAFGELSVSLGAGRRSKEDAIDPTVGIVLEKHLGDNVEEGDLLCTLYVKEQDRGMKLDIEKYYEIV